MPIFKEIRAEIPPLSRKQYHTCYSLFDNVNNAAPQHTQCYLTLVIGTIQQCSQVRVDL